MKVRAGILRFAAFLLILVFMQKTGAGLFLHNLLHTQSIAGKAQVPDEKGKEISYACSCLDDLQVPFLPSGIEIPSPLPLVHVAAVAYYNFELPLAEAVHTSLRGPPAAFVSLFV